MQRPQGRCAPAALLHAAPAAAAAFWASLAASIALNPWYSSLRVQLSVLGTRDACCPWVYNTGIAATGLLVSAYGAALAWDGWRKPGLMLLAAGISLALAAAMPGYSSPYVYATRMFFLLFAVAYATIGMVWLKAGVRGGVYILLASLVAPAIWLVVKALRMWPGSLGEFYGAAVVDALLLYDWWLRVAVRRRKQ